jgi:hypothetical protein
MSNPYFKVLALVIPNLLLVYSTAWPTLEALSERREAFGASDLYLDIKLVGIPRRMAQGRNWESHEFNGVLATDLAQNEVRGTKVKTQEITWYTFDLGEEKFFGWLRAGDTGCEPQLQYRWEKAGKTVKSGVMKAGFCL